HFDADHFAVTLRRVTSVHFQKRRELIFFFGLLNPLKLRREAVAYASPTVILDMDIVRRNEAPRRRASSRQHVYDSHADRAIQLAIRPQHSATPGEDGGIRTIPIVPDTQ